MKNLNEVPFGNWLVTLLKYKSIPDWLIAIIVIVWSVISYGFMVFGGIFAFLWYFINAFWYLVLAAIFVIFCIYVKLLIFDDTLETIKNFEKKKREKND